MKRILLFVLFVLIGTSSAYSQFQKGDWELGCSALFGSNTQTVEYAGQSMSEDQTYLSVSLQPAFYFVDGLSIEPEIGITASENVEPAFLLIGNLSYTFVPKHSKFAPYGKIGLGVSNCYGIPTINSFVKSVHGMDNFVINLGAGIKYMISKSFNLKAELNFRQFKHTETASSWYGNQDATYKSSYINVWFGFSVNL